MTLKKGIRPLNFQLSDLMLMFLRQILLYEVSVFKKKNKMDNCAHISL